MSKADCITFPAFVAACASLLACDTAFAHGFAGKRFFPATLVVDDPFVADELSLPTISTLKMPANDEGPATRESAFSADLAKRITQNFGVEIAADYVQLQPEGEDRQRGFDNLGLGFKYQFHKDDARESIASVAVDIDLGGTGSKRVGAESFSTFTPALFFGKGFGDLPEDMKYLRPFAITGQLGVSIPSSASSTTIGDDGEASVEQHPSFLHWGFTFQYSLIYLQSFVRDVGLREPFNRMIAIVELPLSTGLNRGASGTTGTVNPGIIWSGQYMQLAVEAQLPINKRSGTGVGWIAQLHFYLDDLFPKSLGKPIFGN